MVWIKFSATWKKLKKISFFHQQHQHQPTTNQATTKHKQKTTALTKQIKTENMASLSTSDIDDDDDAFAMLASQFGGESATATRAGDSTAAAISTEIPECLMGVDERTRDSCSSLFFNGRIFITPTAHVKLIHFFFPVNLSPILSSLFFSIFFNILKFLSFLLYS